MGFGVAALAAAIAVLTALAAAFDAVVLRAMPSDRIDRLVSIVQRVPGSTLTAVLLIGDDIENLRADTAVLEDVATYRRLRAMVLDGDGRQQSIETSSVSPNFLRDLRRAARLRAILSCAWP